MQHRQNAFQLPAPPPAILATLLQLDRRTLEATIEAAIERLDAVDGDPDDEPEPDLEREDDRCAAGDDMVYSGAVVRSTVHSEWLERCEIGCEDDAEEDSAVLEFGPAEVALAH